MTEPTPLNFTVTGYPGDPGKSAYQLWLDMGNSGEVSDFLLSLIGAPGDPGKSAYQIWLELGNTGSPQDFINSLKGAPGTPGTGGTGGGGYQSICLFGHPGGQNMTNIQAAEVDFLGTYMPLDLTGKTQARLSAHLVANGGTAEFRLKYTLDRGTNWAYLDGATGPAVNMVSGLNVSAWANIATAAKADVQVKLVTINGDGVLDPNVRRVTLETR